MRQQYLDNKEAETGAKHRALATIDFSGNLDIESAPDASEERWSIYLANV